VKSNISKQDFVRLTVANTLGEYLRPYMCDPAQIKKAQARCIHDAEMLADELWGTTDESESNKLIFSPTAGGALTIVKR